MATTTAYTVAAAAEFAAKPYANLAAAKREADRRAQATGQAVEVRTQATNRLSYTAVAEELVVADQAEVEAALAAEDRAEALGTLAAALGALAAKRQEEAVTAEFDALVAEVKEEAAPKAKRQGRREALGASVVDGWELLYDKPRQRAQVGRNDQGKYALICTDHKHAHLLPRLTAERGLRGGHRSVWCPSCTA
ncbi:hypothetical protein [Streptomyces longwoodensis]|uniref:hypothetical protein n=1 Tax=Streptomyces longwoodensis TaxID=68231 RepID=UPI0036F7AB4A